MVEAGAPKVTPCDPSESSRFVARLVKAATAALAPRPEVRRPEKPAPPPPVGVGAFDHPSRESPGVYRPVAGRCDRGVS